MNSLSIKNLKFNEKVAPIKINYIKSYFDSFLDSKSVNTKKNYEVDLKLFFDFTFQKDVTHVTVEDIVATTSVDAIRYYNFLSTEANNGKPYKNSSINRKINSVRSFYKFLVVDFREINANIFNNVNSKDESVDQKGYGNLTWEEVEEMVRLSLELSETVSSFEGSQTAMLIRLASITSMRLDALLRLTWEENFTVETSQGKDIHVISIVDKAKLHKKPISDDVYEELRSNLSDSGKLFPNLYSHKVGNNIKVLRTHMNIPESRNIRFHSLKKAGVNEVLKRTNNIHLASLQGNHASLNTTQRHYIAVNEDLSTLPSYSLDKEVDLKKAENYTKEQLLKALNKMSDGSKMEFLNLLETL